MISYLYLVAGLAPGTKISQKPLPRTRMAWRRPSQKLKSPTTLTRLAVGREHREGDAGHAVEHHRMRAELLVEMQMRAFAQQVEIEIGQDRRKAIGVFDLDLPFAVARAHAIAARSVGQPALEQPGVVNALEIAFVALLVDDRDVLGIRKEDAHDRRVAFDVRAEIVERVGMATLDDGIGFRRERAHCGASSERERMRQVPASGTRSQSGRCASSYSIS